MLTPDQIDNAQYFHSVLLEKLHKRASFRRNGKTKRWVRDPNRFRIPVKRGLYEYHAITEDQINDWHTETDCPIIKAVSQ